MRILFFASLRERLGIADMELELGGNIDSVADVKALLAARDQDWQQAFNDPALLAAVNQEMVAEDARVTDSDELAFFPPVTGG